MQFFRQDPFSKTLFRDLSGSRDRTDFDRFLKIDNRYWTAFPPVFNLVPLSFQDYSLWLL